jgi:hypothetical protein
MKRNKLFNNDLTEENVYQAIRENLIIAASMTNATYNILEMADEMKNIDPSKVYDTVAQSGKNVTAFIENAARLADILDSIEFNEL